VAPEKPQTPQILYLNQSLPGESRDPFVSFPSTGEVDVGFRRGAVRDGIYADFSVHSVDSIAPMSGMPTASGEVITDSG
jgi:hypothetical protein